ncbi:hypothetical protein [Tenuifilum sp.]|uniref:hypothetical protein n=1 Tax=Tenuifilum sp. TaxID=2760880 RepID=UPI002B656B08|nr:hypothetical protein [Tenuifilum sp.]
MDTNNNIDYVFEIPATEIPDTIAVEKEYKIIKTLKCRNCNKNTYEFIQQAAISESNDGNITGDILTCRCKVCGDQINVKFKFKFLKIESEEVRNYINEYKLAYDLLRAKLILLLYERVNKKMPDIKKLFDNED